MKINFTGKLLNYSDLLKYGNKFVETGSAAGDGIKRALDAGFQEVHSIEAQQEWFDLCLERFQGDPRVFLHYGKSSDVLGTPLIRTTNAGVVFFLDAHPSGPASAGYADVMRFGVESESSQDNIILSELEKIFEWYSLPVIVIDDQRGYDHYVEKYVYLISNWNKEYQFDFYDENLGGNHFYKNKIFVAYPGEK